MTPARAPWVEGRRASAARGRRALADLFRAEILDARRDVPDVSEGIRDGAHPVAVGLVLQREELLRAGIEGALEERVGVLDVEVDVDGRAAARQRPLPLQEIRLLVRHNDRRVADVDLRVAHRAGGVRHAEHLGRAEGLLVEVDGARRALDDEVRRDGVEALGDRARHARASTPRRASA